MNIEKEIKIGGHFYKIIFPYVFTERSDRVGDLDNCTKTIRIAENSYDEPRDKSAITVTLIHEILHGIDNITGHNMFNGAEGESHIEALSEGIYQVLIDNKFLSRSLLGEL